MGRTAARCVGVLVAIVALVATLAPAAVASGPGAATGPLRRHPDNPRYFADDRGRAVYLTGSHTWTNVQDRSLPPRPPLDFAAYLAFLRRHGHNFTRLWTWEQAQGAPWTVEPVRFQPLAFRRTGPGRARDGEPRFDLTAFDPEYFDRLRRRVVAARDAGIYVSVMLFQGWSVESKRLAGNPWPGHPFHRDNNVNGVDGDPDGDGQGLETHGLVSARVTAVQRAYVQRVVDTLNDLDNVLWEISNESHARSTAWQHAMIAFLKWYEATRPRQHLVGMTAQYPDGTNRALFESPADWLSPVHTSAEPYRSDPPPATGAKLIVTDTDHLWGVGGDGAWVWKSFTRGLHPIYMDPMDQDPRDRQASPAARRAMGDTLRWAHRVNLARMVPRPELASSRFCLADVGAEYLVYVPLTRAVIVDLGAAPGRVAVEWFHPATGETRAAGAVEGGASRFFTAPFTGDKVLYLRVVPPPPSSNRSRTSPA